MKICVSGASGQLGRLVGEELLSRLDIEEIVMMSRTPEALPEFADRGVELRYGDFDVPESLPEAFSGCDRALLISSMAVGRRLEQHRTAIEAATEAGVQRVVYTSVTNPVEGHPCGGLVDENRLTEELLRDGDVAWTVLRNSAYAELQVPLGAVAITYGKLVTNAGDGRVAPISRADCAAAAAAVLTGEGHEGQTYEITGPEAFSQADIAKLLTEVSGRSVTVVHTGDRRLRWGLGRLGTPKPIAQSIVNLGIATREGYFDVVDGAFQRLAGRRPQMLREVLMANRVELTGVDTARVAYG
ncbi:MAG TPA: SDR family oxidoreductase [Solirubrobacteraceae bacterium]|jgi:NAD(P)H dehydrogenase (quinone)|nr:SDR family oxidoreductase [Solirubrobacteraceae bacterium]